MNKPNEHADHSGAHGGHDDPGLTALSDRLDALGASEAAGSPEGLEDRVLAGVAGVYAPQPIAIGRGASPWWRGGAVRAAAGVAVIGGITLLAYLQSPGRSGPGANGPEVISVAMVEQRIEGLLALASHSGDDLDNQIASIQLWADALGAESGDLWDSQGLLDPENNGNGAL